MTVINNQMLFRLWLDFTLGDPLFQAGDPLFQAWIFKPVFFVPAVPPSRWPCLSV